LLSYSHAVCDRRRGSRPCDLPYHGNSAVPTSQSIGIDRESSIMRPRIAIPLPLSDNREYVERSLPQYEEAVRIAGGEAVRIPLDRDAGEVLKIAQSCQAVLLPGASAD